MKAGKDRTSYAIALQDVEATFDTLKVGPAATQDNRDWVMEAEAARMLGLSKKALERRRDRGTAPVHHKRYGFIAYHLDELDRWVATKPKGYRPPPSE